MYQKAEGRFEQLPGYEAGSCGAGEKEEMMHSDEQEKIDSKEDTAFSI